MLDCLNIYNACKCLSTQHSGLEVQSMMIELHKFPTGILYHRVLTGICRGGFAQNIAETVPVSGFDLNSLCM